MNQNSWLYSDSFLRRAFAIWGHYFVANLIIGACVAVIAFIVAITFGMTFSSMTSVTGEQPTVNVEIGR